MGNRPPGGYVASKSLSLADNRIANTHRQNQNALRFGRFGFTDTFSAPTVFGLLRSPKTQPPSGRLPTLRSTAQFHRGQAPRYTTHLF
ncbi:MAG: hypothetical protein LBQ66_01630 [Planctomycetaceae bacterium]|nr:hypothetical protein [Planctomycetaceae bacterium]